MPNSRIKNEEKYKALLDKGYSKQKSARIANTPDSGSKGGKAEKYEEWTKEELNKQAKKTQEWQLKYFLEIPENNPMDCLRAKFLYLDN